MNKPNFFMVGAPKCGTTAMARYLSRHPNIWMSNPKEPYYFNRHLISMASQQKLRGPHNNLDDYLALFTGAGSSHLAIGEASTTYLMDERALSEIYEFSPTAKIIAMLRNPVELVYAFHSELYFHALETIQDFWEAWNFQEVRAQGKQIPSSSRMSATLQYGRVGRLGDQVEKMLTIFPSENVLLVFYDDFRANNRVQYEKILTFLEVPFDNQCDFEKINQNKVIQQGFFLRLIKSESPLRRVSNFLKQRFGVSKWGIVDSIQKRSSSVQPRPPLPPETRKELIDFFRSDILKLQTVANRDLSTWLSMEETK